MIIRKFINITIILLIISFYDNESAKILLYPSRIRSHNSYFSKLGKGLAKMGHNIDLLMASGENEALNGGKTESRNINESIGLFKIIKYKASTEIAYVDSPEMAKLFMEIALSTSFITRFSKSLSLESSVRKRFFQECIDLMSNLDLRRQLNDTGYQFVIIDPVTPQCSLLLPVSMNVPYGIFSISWVAWMFRVPRLPSFTPFLGDTKTDRMTFFQRLTNFVEDCLTLSMLSGSEMYDDPFMANNNENKHSNSIELLNKGSFWLFLEDIAVSYPNAQMPNTLNIGDVILDTTHASILTNLPEQLHNLMKYYGQYDGCIIVSFGSFFDDIPNFVQDQFCKAFKNFQKTICFIWKLKKSIDEVCPNAKNIYIMSWLPQNSLLANPTVKLFITHGGINSLIESVNYAKPMIIFPIAIDQHGNAAMAVSKGYALAMELSSFSEGDLIRGIECVLRNDSYRKTVEFYSLIMKDKLEKPEARVSDLIDHVIKFGDGHLKTSAYQLNWFQFFMFDVFIFLFLVLSLCATILFVCSWYLFKFGIKKITKHYQRKIIKQE